MARDRNSRLVFSTEFGRTCSRCGEALGRCRCATSQDRIFGDGNIRVGRETKGRAGKGVTLVTGLTLNAADLGALATALKKRCGTGGTVKDGAIEIQGDHRDVVTAELLARGFKAKRTGG